MAAVGGRNQRSHIADHSSIQLSRSSYVMRCLASIGVTDPLERLYPPDVGPGPPALASSHGAQTLDQENNVEPYRPIPDVVSADSYTVGASSRIQLYVCRDSPVTPGRAVGILAFVF